MRSSKIMTAIGIFFLALGVGLYLRLALSREGALVWPFLCCMASLLFFNLPAVIQRYNNRGPGGRERNGRPEGDDR